MAQMAATTTAVHFGAGHAKRRISGFCDGMFERGVKAWPARVTVEFGAGGKQLKLAPGTGKAPGSVLIVEWAAARPFGCTVAQHLELICREQRAPLGLGVGHLEDFASTGRSCRRRGQGPPVEQSCRRQGDAGRATKKKPSSGLHSVHLEGVGGVSLFFARSHQVLT